LSSRKSFPENKNKQKNKNKTRLLAVTHNKKIKTTLTTGLYNVLPNLKRLGLHPIKQVRVVDALPELGKNIHQPRLPAGLEGI